MKLGRRDSGVGHRGGKFSRGDFLDKIYRMNRIEKKSWPDSGKMSAASGF